MAVAMVNENGISQINLHDGGSTLMVITPSGVLGRNYRLNNSNFVQYNDRVVFLLKNGLKFEVTWNRLTKLSLNILRLGQGSTGLVSTLASLNAHVSNNERVDNEVPVEIQVNDILIATVVLLLTIGLFHLGQDSTHLIWHVYFNWRAGNIFVRC